MPNDNPERKIQLIEIQEVLATDAINAGQTILRASHGLFYEFDGNRS